MDQPAVGVDARLSGKGGSGKDQMRMTGHQRVDARDPGKRHRGVFHPRPVGVVGSDSGMRQGHDDLRPLGAHPGHEGAGGLDDVSGLDPAREMLAVPCHDLRRGQADHPDAQRVAPPRAIGQVTVEQRIGGEGSAVLCGVCAPVVREIGQHHGKARGGGAGQQEIETIVEVVVAQRGRVIAQSVHRGDQGMGFAGAQAAFRGDVIAHGIALQKVSVVEQQAVGGLGAGLADQQRGA